MSPLAISGIVFAIIFAGALFGIFLRTRLPDHHLSAESKDVVKMTMGILGTMTALVLSLLIASAKNSYDTQRNGISQLAANILVLDRTLALYGKDTQGTPEGKKTQDARELRRYKRRWKIERLFAWLHNFRRVRTRDDWYADNYEGFVLLACMVLLLKHFLDRF